MGHHDRSRGRLPLEIPPLAPVVESTCRYSKDDHTKKNVLKRRPGDS